MGNRNAGASRARRHKAAKRRLVVASTVTVIGVGAGIGVAGAQASGAPRYRTAVAKTGSAVRSLAVTGTVQPVDEAQPSFQVAGTVTAIEATVGQHVNAGQTLATIDSTSLQEQVALDQATLSSAEARLTQDESGQASSSTASGSAPVSSGTALPSGTPQAAAETSGGKEVVLTATGAGGGGSGATAPSLSAAQQAVVSTQQAADADVQAADTAFASARSACGGPQPGTHSGSVTSVVSPTINEPSAPTSSNPSPSTGSSTATPSTTTPSTTTPSTTTPSTTTPSTTTPSTTPPSSATPSTTTPPVGSSPTTTAPSFGTSATCTNALGQALATEQQVSKSQQKVLNAEEALAQMLSRIASSSASPGAGSTSGSASAKPFGGSTPTGPYGGSTAGSNTPASSATDSAAQLASDQATIDSDQAALVAAQQFLADATLAAPISGTVAAVDIAVGQTVSTGSTTAVVTITNAGIYQATASLTSSQVPEVKVGDPVQMTVDGQSMTLTGTVSRLDPVSVGNSSFTYPVVVSLDSEPATSGIPAGSSAQLQIQIAEIGGTLVVPTSAVHTEGTGKWDVYVLRSSREMEQTVKVGVVGQIYTQITSGLAQGAVVVLADPSQPVPSSSANSLNTPGAGFGGFGTTGSAGGVFARSGARGG